MNKKLSVPFGKFRTYLFTKAEKRRRRADFPYLRELERCQLCGLCQIACPLVNSSGLEALGPRAKISLLKAFLEGSLTSGELEPLFSACLHCGQCDRTCSLSLPLQNIFAAAQAKYLVRKGSWRSQLLYLFKRHPGLADFLQFFLAMLTRSLKKRKSTPVLPILPKRSFKIRDTAKDKSKENPGQQILLFPGCIGRYVTPDISESTSGLVRLLGYKLIAPSLLCCGRSNRVNGKSDEALTLARKNLKLISALDFSYLLLACPACMQEIIQHWPELDGLTAEEKKQAMELAGKCVSLDEFVEKHRENRPFSLGADKICVHISCQTPEATASRIKRLLPADLSSVVNKGDSCCGAFVSYSEGMDIRAKKQAEEAGKNLLNYILSQKPGQVYTTCPACALQLERIMAQTSETVPVSHVSKLYHTLFMEEKNKK